MVKMFRKTLELYVQLMNFRLKQKTSNGLSEGVYSRRHSNYSFFAAVTDSIPINTNSKLHFTLKKASQVHMCHRKFILHG